jgi:2-iminobutanoate/2-iminopropanoate deaminase
MFHHYQTTYIDQSEEDTAMGMSFIVGPNMEGLPLSEAVRAGDFLFVSGMCGFDDNGSIVKGGVGAETDRIMKDLIDVLARADTDLSRIAKVNVYLTSADDFDAFNAVYASYFPGNKAARIGVVAGMTINARIEMDFTAYLGD